MSNINKQALREAAEKATPGNWWIDSHGQAMVSFIDNDVLEVFATDNKRTAVRHEDTGNLSRWRNDNDATFIATTDPATVLALLDELEDSEKRIAELERGSKVIKCWSCQKSVTVDQVTAEDGFCPSCNCGIDLDDYETAELVAAGIITKVGE
ncbi:ead/Ea22-like family protein [Enterobacter hormaechei]